MSYYDDFVNFIENGNLRYNPQGYEEQYSIKKAISELNKSKLQVHKNLAKEFKRLYSIYSDLCFDNDLLNNDGSSGEGQILYKQ